RNTRFTNICDGVQIAGGRVDKADELTGRRSIVEPSNTLWPGAKVGEVARRQVLGKVLIAGRQDRSVGIEFSPQVRSAVPRHVRFKDKATTEISFKAGVRLVALGNP